MAHIIANTRRLISWKMTTSVSKNYPEIFVIYWGDRRSKTKSLEQGRGHIFCKAYGGQNFSIGFNIKQCQFLGILPLLLLQFLNLLVQTQTRKSIHRTKLIHTWPFRTYTKSFVYLPLEQAKTFFKTMFCSQENFIPAYMVLNVKVTCHSCSIWGLCLMLVSALQDIQYQISR